MRKPGKYHLLAADMYSVMSTVEFAGTGRVFYIDEVPYYYTYNSGCGNQVNLVAERVVRMKTPFLRL